MLLSSDGTLYHTSNKLEKWCEEGLDGQHPNIRHRSGRDFSSLHRQGIIALRIVTAREHEEATSHSASEPYVSCVSLCCAQYRRISHL